MKKASIMVFLLCLWACDADDAENLFEAAQGKGADRSVSASTGKVSLPCKDAACTHDPDDASAKVCPVNRGRGNPEQYGGRIYAEIRDYKSTELVFLIVERKDRMVRCGKGNGIWN